MVDAEDRVFREHRLRDAVELSRGRQVAPERLFDDDARPVGQTRSPKPLDDRREERGRDGEVVRRALSTTQRLFYRRERVPVIIVALYIPEQGQKVLERAPVIDPTRLCDALRHTCLQLRQTPLRGGDTDHRNPQCASFCHCIERREDLLVGEITRHTEEYQRIR